MIVHDWNGHTVIYDNERHLPNTPYTSLETWREHLSCISPHMFWQLKAEDCSDCGPCKEVVKEQRHFPGAHLGREQIRKAILRAENELHKILGYPVVPTWISKVVPIHQDGKFYLHNKYVHKIGIPTIIPVEDVEVNLLKRYYGSCIDEFQVKLCLDSEFSYSDPDEFCLFHHSSNIPQKRARESLERWKISPVESYFDGNTLVINGRAWTIVKPELYENTMIGDIDASDLNSFASCLSVYKCSVDECSGVLAMYKRVDNCDCGEWDCTHCYEACPVQACLDNPNNGQGSIDLNGLYKGSGIKSSCVCPEKLCVNYLSYDHTRDWTNEIVALSAAYLYGDVCDCRIPCLSNLLEDLSKSGANKNDKRMVTFDQLDNPLGTLKGHKIVWDVVSRLRSKKYVSIRM